MSATETYQVQIDRDHLIFCAAHFISFEGHQCERLHGHNYRVSLDIEGPLSADYYVIDFVTLTRLARKLVAELDHRMLLPARNPVIQVQSTAVLTTVTYREKSWQFPTDDCVILPLENTTAEQLACYLAHRLIPILLHQMKFMVQRLRVQVEENVGQSASYEWLSSKPGVSSPGELA